MGPERTTNLADPVDVQRTYQAVIRIGTIEDQRRWLNRDLLMQAWPTLVLPVRCAAAWEARFAELRQPLSRLPASRHRFETVN